MIKSIVVTAVLLMITSLSWSQQLAFPGAEGFGAYARGGRGGAVIHVTNLHDSGFGSLRYAIAQEVPRTIVFAVSGIIDLQSKLIINNPYITIAGQTAPGDGICIRGQTLEIATHDVVIRYIRARLGDSLRGKGSKQGKDALSISAGENIIIDHCSASWSLDEILSTSTMKPDLTNVTVQWCFITEALNPEGHGFGSLIRGTGGAKYSYLHNLYAHNRSRNPRPGNYNSNPHDQDPEGLLLDFRYNVIYNWDGDFPGYNADAVSVTRLNYVGNYVIPGLNSRPTGIAYAEGSPYNLAYFEGNYYAHQIPPDQWSLVKFPNKWTAEQVHDYKQDQPFPTGPIAKHHSKKTYDKVIDSAGAILPKRDGVDIRIVETIQHYQGKIIASQEEVGGWPEYHSNAALQDTDNDGMPDDWEIKSKLNKTDPEDRNKLALDGYSMLEKYLNSLTDNARSFQR